MPTNDCRTCNGFGYHDDGECRRLPMGCPEAGEPGDHECPACGGSGVER